MTDIEMMYYAEYLLRKIHKRMCDEAESYFPFEGEDVVIGRFLLDNTGHTPQETMKLLLYESISRRAGMDAESEWGPKGGCYDCDFGNGEGGCTIPGYCPYRDGE